MSRRPAIALGALLAAALAVALLLRRGSSSSPAPSTARSQTAAADANVARPATSTAPSRARFADAGAHASPHVLARGAWGSGPGEFAHKLDPESAPEGPMSLTADGAGNLLVLDQLNHRIQRWTRDGRRLPPIAIGGDTAQDLAAARDGRLVLLDRLGEQNVQVLDAAGRPLGDVALRGGKLPGPRGVTGLDLDDNGHASA